MSDEARKVNCKTCGMLAVRHYSTQEPIEAIQVWRDGGYYGGAGHVAKTANWLCYAGMQLPPRQEPKEGKVYLAAALQIETEITCQKWQRYWPGKSPKEHEEMTIVERMKADYAQQRVEDRQLQQQIEALYESRHQELRRDAKESGKWTRIIAICAAVASALAALVAFATYLSRP